MTISVEGIVEKRDDHLVADIGEETLMMRIESGRYYAIEGTGKVIWDSIDGPTPVLRLVDLLTSRYDVDRDTCEAQTLGFLNDLLAQKLITHSDV